MDRLFGPFDHGQVQRDYEQFKPNDLIHSEYDFTWGEKKKRIYRVNIIVAIIVKIKIKLPNCCKIMTITSLWIFSDFLFQFLIGVPTNSTN